MRKTANTNEFKVSSKTWKQKIKQPEATYEEIDAEEDDEFGREAGGNNY